MSVLRKYSALALYLLLLCLPAAALLLYHYVNTRYYGGALGSGMADIAGMLLIGAVAVHVPEYDSAEGRFVRRGSGRKSRVLGGVYSGLCAALFAAVLIASAAYRPAYTVDEAELALEGAGYSEIAPAFKLKAPDGVNPFIEWAPVFSAVDGAGRDVDVVFHMSSGDFSELNI